MAIDINNLDPVELNKKIKRKSKSKTRKMSPFDIINDNQRLTIYDVEKEDGSGNEFMLTCDGGSITLIFSANGGIENIIPHPHTNTPPNSVFYTIFDSVTKIFRR